MKKIIVYLLAIILMTGMVEITAFASQLTTVQLNDTKAKSGDMVKVSGLMDANSWGNIKVIDKSEHIIYFNAFKADSLEDYTHSFIVPTIEAQTLNIVVGNGTNVASTPLEIYKSRSNKHNKKEEQEKEVKEEDGKIIIKIQGENEENGQAEVVVSSDNIETALESAEKNKSEKKVVTVNIEGGKTTEGYRIGLPIAFLKYRDEMEINIKTEVATVTLQGNMLRNNGEESGTISLNFELVDFTDEKQKNKFDKIDNEILEKIGNRPVFEINLTEDGEIRSWESEEVPVTISIPYTLQEGECSEHIVVWYIDGEGNVHEVTNRRYDEETGMVVFDVYHFSTYSIAYEEATFKDLEKYSWAKDEIEVLASKGIIKGTGKNNYSPKKNITRADFLTLLVRTLELKADFKINFDDVDVSDYYYEAIGIGKALGITEGIDNNLFNPLESISREDMMVMAYRCLRIKGLTSEQIKGTELEHFIDIDELADYADEGACELVSQGLIQGSDKRLNPKKYTTRAEVAVLIYRIYKLK